MQKMIWLAMVCLALLCSCQQETVAVVYSKETAFRPWYNWNGHDAYLRRNGRALAPPWTPSVVKRAVAAANKIEGKPYRRGGGHKQHHDSGYDCSGSVTFVLREAGLIGGAAGTSTSLRNYGIPGEGKYITIYTRPGHAFMVICGLRYDTTGGRGNQGPGWRVNDRSTRGFTARHPECL